MRWPRLPATRPPIRVLPPLRPRLPSSRRTNRHHRRLLSFGSISKTLKSIRSLLPSNARGGLDTWLKVMAQPAPPADLSLLQQLLGLGGQSDAKELQDAVFVCIDCEAFEFDQSKIMEVGVSVLDTARIDRINPEITEADLIANIESAHYRINEYGHLRNKRFVKGNPDGFAFGSSTWVKRSDAKTVLSRLFQDAGNLSNASKLNQPAIGPARNVVLVAHGIKNEVDYLKFLGFGLNEAENVVRRIDTSTVLTNKKNQVGLKRLLQAIGVEVETKHLHNAGNDAAYTLRGLMTIAVKEHAVPGSLLSCFPKPPELTPEEIAARKAAKKAAREQKQAARKQQQKKQKDGQEEQATTTGAANVEPRAAPSRSKGDMEGLRKQLQKAARRSRSRSP